MVGVVHITKERGLGLGMRIEGKVQEGDKGDLENEVIVVYGRGEDRRFTRKEGKDMTLSRQTTCV